MKVMRTVIALNGVLNLQMRSEGSHNTSGRERRERIGMTFPFPDMSVPCCKDLMVDRDL